VTADMRAVCVVLLSLLALASAVDEGNRENTKNCFITGEPAVKPRSLSFCHKFNDNACCAPAMDSENNEMFDSLMQLGLSCRLRGDVRSTPMAKIYCMNCDPQQPRYVRNEPLVPYCDPRGDCGDGEANYQMWRLYPGDAFSSFNSSTEFTAATLPNITAPDATAVDGEISVEALDSLAGADLVSGQGADTLPDLNTGFVMAPINKRSNTILLCRDWVTGNFGGEFKTDSNKNNWLSIFNQCGVLKSTPCSDVDGNPIPGRDRYFCGDDLIMPSVTYTRIEEFLNDFSMMTPQLDENFGFKVVDNRPCTDAELDALVQANGDTPLASALLKPSVWTDAAYNQFNPNCLRTAAQINKYGVSAWSSSFNSTAWFEGGKTYDYIEADTSELCFNGVAAAVPAFFLCLAVVLLALL
jgi:hypothetical protein